MYNKKLILVGYSGHGFVLAEAALDNQFSIIGYTDKIITTNNPFQLDYLGYEGDQDFKGWEMEVDFLIGIGNNRLREKIFKLISGKGKKTSTIISPSSSVSKYAVIGDGVFINRNASVNAFARIGDNVILNTNCTIEHECIINDNAHIAPGAILSGNVLIGERSFIGANSVVKQGVSIGKDVIVGAGTVVVKDIPDGKKVVGNPSRLI